MDLPYHHLLWIITLKWFSSHLNWLCSVNRFYRGHFVPVYWCYHYNADVTVIEAKLILHAFQVSMYTWVSGLSIIQIKRFHSFRARQRSFVLFFKCYFSTVLHNTNSLHALENWNTSQPSMNDWAHSMAMKDEDITQLCNSTRRVIWLKSGIS